MKNIEMKEEEVWKDIPDVWGNIPNITNYQASTLGRIRYHNKIIKQNLPKENGYLVCNIRRAPGKYKTFNVHQLIAITHLNHVPQGRKLHIDHKDWNKTNNMVDNLQILTARQNAAKDSFRRKSVKTPAGSIFNKTTRKYDSTIFYEYNVINLGSFDTSTEAVDAYNKALDNLHIYDEVGGDRIKFLKAIDLYREPEIKYERYRKGTNILKGVYQNSNGTFSTEFSIRGKKVYLGTYKTKDECAVIYELAHKYQNVYKGCNKSFVNFLKNRL